MKLLVDDPKYCDVIVTKLRGVIQGELKTLGSKKANSILRNKTKAGLLSFSWNKVWKELEMHAPIFLGLLEAILSCKTAKISRTQPIV